MSLLFWDMTFLLLFHYTGLVEHLETEHLQSLQRISVLFVDSSEALLLVTSFSGHFYTTKLFMFVFSISWHLLCTRHYQMQRIES